MLKENIFVMIQENLFTQSFVCLTFRFCMSCWWMLFQRSSNYADISNIRAHTGVKVWVLQRRPCNPPEFPSSFSHHTHIKAFHSGMLRSSQSLSLSRLLFKLEVSVSRSIWTGPPAHTGMDWEDAANFLSQQTAWETATITVMELPTAHWMKCRVGFRF